MAYNRLGMTSTGMQPEIVSKRSAGLTMTESADGGQALPREYLEGIRLFNEREFFECHDVLEELWTDFIGPERNFYKGLIQAAVALYHFSEGNLHGARKLFRSSSKYLEPYQPRTLQLDVTRFLEAYRVCFHAFENGNPNANDVVLDESLIPRIDLDLNSN